jgi:hypothetical protein
MDEWINHRWSFGLSGSGFRTIDWSQTPKTSGRIGARIDGHLTGNRCWFDYMISSTPPARAVPLLYPPVGDLEEDFIPFLRPCAPMKP